jgi:hypothetical protein
MDATYHPEAPDAAAPGDFRFQYGDWRVSHRRLKERLCGSTQWETFEGTCRAWPVMGGFGICEDNCLDLPAGAYRAVALRSFDAGSGAWSIWWLDGRHPHTLDTPVVGSFRNGDGTFLARDVFAGRPILVRVLWLNTRSPSPRWEQAFSPDDGASWETNWTMDFHRLTSPTAPPPACPPPA